LSAPAVRSPAAPGRRRPGPLPERKVSRPPSRGFVAELGGMLHLAVLAGYRAVRPPYSYGPEFVAQFKFTIRVCFFPLVITAFALSFGPAGIQASNFFGLFGSFDRLGGAYVIIVVRLFAPLVTAIVLAGAAGTAICADLGARQVRDETDALRVMGVDPVKHLVVPRLLAIMLAAILFDIFALVAGLLGAVVVVIQNDAALGPFFSTFFSNATTLELLGSLVKCGVYGAMIAIVCCYKGMNAKGGPEGVGRAVNQAVVIAFLAIGFIDYFFVQLLLATNPILSEVRG
jgi:phospholipid/cholesterol/gamma-HCH transport system permease protein